ncbi:integrase [Caudoviricetes sp.]|nr:integrase [Caudoviricetes sp.]
MSRSRGQIIEKATGTYLVRIHLGARKYRGVTVKGSRRDADQKLTALLREKDVHHAIQPTKLTVHEYFDRWLTSKAPEIAPRTLQSYSDLLRLHIRPALGALRLEQVSPMLLQDVITDLSSKLSPRMVQYTATVVAQAFKCAVQWRLLHQSPAVYLRLPRRIRTEQPILSADQVKHLFAQTLGSPWRPLWVLLLTTGLRPQELLALQWGDLTPDGTLRVQRALCQTTPGHYEVGETKTRGSRRALMVPGEVLTVLEAHRMVQTRLSPWIFSNREGTPWDISKVRKAWYRDLEAAGLPKVRLYATRHTHLSHLVMATGSLKVAQERAGHSSIRLTADTYTHLLKESHEETAGVVRRMFFSA